MKPKRIQRKRTRGWKMPRNTVYVGRPTKWGNPFLIGQTYPYAHSPALTRQQTIELFEDYLKNEFLGIQIKDVKRELRGKNLACWCPLGEPCHADALLKLANQP